MKNNRGSLLIELSIAIFLLLVFLAGLTKIHSAWSKRFQKIIEHRNYSIQKIRKIPAPEFFPAIKFYRPSDRLMDKHAEQSK